MLAWIDTNHYFHYVMSQLSNVNDNKFVAASLFNGRIDYLGFVSEMEDKMKEFEKRSYDKQTRFDVVNMVRNCIARHLNNGGKIND